MVILHERRWYKIRVDTMLISILIGTFANSINIINKL